MSSGHYTRLQARLAHTASSTSPPPASSVAAQSHTMADPNANVTSLLAALVASQQAMQQQYNATQQQLADFQQQQVVLQQQQNQQQQQSSEKSLARAAAGAAPHFHGKANDIEVHRWCIALERWFETAKVDQDDEKLIIAASVLRDSAQSWWQSKKEANEANQIVTWSAFRDTIRKHYLPMDVDRWAYTELAILLNSANSNITEYTARYYELNQLLPNRGEMDRLMSYEQGLPAEYKTDCAKKRYTTLKAASEAAVATYNALRSSGNRGRAAAGVHQMEADSWNGAVMETHSSSSSSASPSPYQAEGYGANLPASSTTCKRVQVGRKQCHRCRSR